MSVSPSQAGFSEALAERTQSILDACTQCGSCFDACPMTGPAGIASAHGPAVVAGILDLVSGGEAPGPATVWAEACSGSGFCIPACPEAINPRFMMSLARLSLRSKAEAKARSRGGASAFAAMTHGVRALSQIQLAPGTLARFRDRRDVVDPEVVFYTGCNLLKTPHIALLCFDILDRLEITYRVQGGPGDCCGVLQYRTGDVETSGRIAYRTLDRFAEAKSPTVLSWCPTCQVQLGENVLPGYQAQRPETAFTIESFVLFLSRHLERLRPHLVHRVEKRVGLHEHPGVFGVAEAAGTLLRAVPGVTFVDLRQPSVGWMCNTLQPLPAYKRSVHQNLLEAAAEAQVTTLAGVYHACHRELCSHEQEWPFEIVNFLEVIGASMGIAHEDHFKRLKIMGDVDMVLADAAETAALNGLDLEAARDVIARDLLGEQPLPLRARSQPLPLAKA